MTGSGTALDPYIISDVTDLQAMEDDLDAYYELGNDIDASATSGWNSEAGFAPIGDYGEYFTGHFDGKGFAIDQLFINRPSTDNVGLFGITRAIGIKNVELTSCDITGEDYVGALVGELYGYASNIAVIENCSSSGSITGERRVGGLFGEVVKYTHITQVRDCHSSCTVTSTNSYAGGFVGRLSDCDVSKCYATGSVTINAGDTYSYGGGFVGHTAAGYTTQCYATGDVVVNSDSATRRAEAGGFTANAGLTSGEILTFLMQDCYARGDVTANNVGGNLEYAGGFIARFFEDDGTIDNCYSTGAVSGYVHGGFCADDGGTNTTISNCFWDTETSGEASSDGGTGKTTAEMKIVATFIIAGWDFDAIWYIRSDENNGYPSLGIAKGEGAGVYAVVENQWHYVDAYGRERALLGELV